MRSARSLAGGITFGSRINPSVVATETNEQIAAARKNLRVKIIGSPGGDRNSTVPRRKIPPPA
jgi:hypothetical protein